MTIPSVFHREKTINKVVLIQTEDILPNPAQPRYEFRQEELQSLAESIKENGILQPLTVRRNLKGQFELISGERRLRAAKLAGMAFAPCIIMETDGRQSAVFALLENIQRQDLNFFEEAKALNNLILEWNITQEEAAVRLGMAQSTVANKIRLLKLSEGVQQKVVEYHLTERHARALLKLREEHQQVAAADFIGKNKLNVAKAEQYIEKLIKYPLGPIPKRKIPIIKDVRLFLNTVNKAIDTMKKAGIPAEAKKKEQDDYIEYVVRIPLQHV